MTAASPSGSELPPIFVLAKVCEARVGGRRGGPPIRSRLRNDRFLLGQLNHAPLGIAEVCVRAYGGNDDPATT